MLFKKPNGLSSEFVLIRGLVAVIKYHSFGVERFCRRYTRTGTAAVDYPFLSVCLSDFLHVDMWRILIARHPIDPVFVE